MQYSKHEVPLEKKDISLINSFSSFARIVPIGFSFLSGIGVLLVLFMMPQFMGWLTTLFVVIGIIGFNFLVHFLFKKLFLAPITIEIKGGVKIEHRGCLTNKRNDITYSREHGKHLHLDTYYITLNDTEIKIGDVKNYSTPKLYESLIIGKNYKVFQSIRDVELIFGVEEII